MQNPHRALEAIEQLAADDFAVEMEWLLSSGKRIDRRLKEAARRIGRIYMIAHSEGRCRHKDWEEVKNQVLTEYKDY